MEKLRWINDKTTTFKSYDFIICSTYGNPRSKSFHFKYWKQLLKENNLPDIRFHDLRSTYSPLLLKNNFNSKAISKLMGYATDIITIDVYGDNDEIIADCVDELDSFIESVRPENNELGIQIWDESDISIDENILNELTVF